MQLIHQDILCWGKYFHGCSLRPTQTSLVKNWSTVINLGIPFNDFPQLISPPFHQMTFYDVIVNKLKFSFIWRFFSWSKQSLRGWIWCSTAILSTWCLFTRRSYCSIFQQKWNPDSWLGETCPRGNAMKAFSLRLGPCLVMATFWGNNATRSFCLPLCPNHTLSRRQPSVDSTSYRICSNKTYFRQGN